MLLALTSCDNKLHHFDFCSFFEPTCAHARWALMHRFLSVCLSVRLYKKLRLEKSHSSKSIIAGYVTEILLQANVHQCNMLFKKKQVGSRQRQVAFFFFQNEPHGCFLFIYPYRIKHNTSDRTISIDNLQSHNNLLLQCIH